MKVKKNQDKVRLGRGLAALLGNIPEPIQDNDKEGENQPGFKLLTVPVEMLAPGPFQPRQVMKPEALKELAESIKSHGILQPLLIRKNPDKKGYYQIIAGERRWRAAQMAKLHDVPVRVCDLSDRDAMAAALVENLQRADLNIIEEADGFSRLIEEFKLTQDELSSAVGKSRSHVTNILRLLQLPDEVLVYLKEGQLSAGHARALLMHPDPVAAAKEVIARELTVRQTEDLVKKNKNKKPQNHTEQELINSEIEHLEKDLQGKLGLKVQLQFNGKSGFIRIFYKSLEQFDEILHVLKK